MTARAATTEAPGMSTTRYTPSSSAPEAPQEQTTWAIFAGVVLILSGSFSVLYGLAAILNDEVVRVGGRGVMVWDFTTWGWITLIIGAAMGLTALGLLAGMGVARWLAVLFAGLNAIGQFGMVSAFPLFSILIIALDVLVIYHLIVNWHPNRR
jgi:hypothetical protein